MLQMYLVMIWTCQVGLFAEFRRNGNTNFLVVTSNGKLYGNKYRKILVISVRKIVFLCADCFPGAFTSMFTESCDSFPSLWAFVEVYYETKIRSNLGLSGGRNLPRNEQECSQSTCGIVRPCYLQPHRAQSHFSSEKPVIEATFWINVSQATREPICH